MDKTTLENKSLLGHSENAVKVQIYCAIITFLTVVLLKEKMKTSLTQYQILQILSIALPNKTPLNQLFQGALLQYVKEQKYNQLKIF